MMIENVPIRTVKELDDKDEKLLGVFLNTKKSVPLIYQYAETKRYIPHDNIDEIGKASNFRLTTIEGDVAILVCDVSLNSLLTNSKMFDGVIDNYTIKYNKNNDMELIRVIIYNSELKRSVDTKRGEIALKRMGIDTNNVTEINYKDLN